MKNDTGEMSMSEEAKQNAWAEHYERLLNVEFDWDPDHLSNEPPLEGSPIPMKKVNKQCLLDTPHTVRFSEKTWQVIVQTSRPKF